MFIEDAQKAVQEKKRMKEEEEKLANEKRRQEEGVDYILAGDNAPHRPLLDPNAHALTGSPPLF